MDSHEKRRQRREAERLKASHSAKPQKMPTPCQGGKSPQAIPRWIEEGLKHVKRRVRWTCGAVLALLIAGRWIKEKDYWVNWVFRFLAVLSVSYLFLDRIYETGATISIAASDPHDPMAFPFTLTNVSHIWKLHDVAWECDGLRFDIDGRYVIGGVGIKTTSEKPVVVNEGQTINFDCFRSKGRRVLTVKALSDFTGGDVQVLVSYRIALWHPTRTIKFRWIGKASNPQWIRGDFVN